MKYRCVALLSLLLALFYSGTLLPSRALADPRGEYVPGEVLVGVRAESARLARVARLADTVGRVAQQLPALQAYRVQLRPGLSVPDAIARLRARGDILYAEPNFMAHLCATPNDPYYARQQPTLQRIQADLAWDIWQPKQQVVIAIVDSGIDDKHPDLTHVIYRDAAGAIIGYNALTGGSNTLDDELHGTGTAGIAAAQINNGIGIAGIAGWNPAVPGSDTFVKLMAVKVFSSTQGDDASVAAGILWAADHGARVINMSLGTGPATIVNKAIQYAWGRGCVLTAAAANGGSSAKTYPGAFNNVISVTATDLHDQLCFFSEYGPWVKAATISPWPQMLYSTTLGDRYNAFGATSGCAPQVAAEAALIMAQNPLLSNSEVSQIILSHVDPYAPYNGRTLARAAGRINIYRALQAAGTGTPVLTSITLNPARIKGGETAGGTMFLGGRAPAGGQVVKLASSDPATVLVPDSVMVAEGATAARFTVTTPAVEAAAAVTITASTADATKTASFVVLPLALSFVSLSERAVSEGLYGGSYRTEVAGGASTSGKVILNGPAPSGGAVVRLSSSNSVAPVPPDVTVPAGATSATFQIMTSPVTADTSASIAASYGGVTDTSVLMVRPQVGWALKISPARLAGGTLSTGQVTLASPAPEGGVLIDLSANGAGVSTPEDVTVAPGATTATFPITTGPVRRAASSFIVGSRLGQVKKVTLTVTP